MKLALGTAQFGMDYGVANKQGRPPITEIKRILEMAKTTGIDTVDTAAVYGDSEQRLGNAGVGSFKVVSKIPARPANCSTADWVSSSVKESLTNLQSQCLHGLLLHRPMELLEDEGNELYEALVSLKTQGLINKIGVSVYSPDELAKLVPAFKFDIVQAPMNLIDQRLFTSGWLDRLDDLGVEVHTRSAFLQGLLLMSIDDLPDYFKPWRALFARFGSWISEYKLSPLEACLGYLNQFKQIDRVIVGVESSVQLQQVIAASSSMIPPPPDDVHSGETGLINPASWNLKS